MPLRSLPDLRSRLGSSDARWRARTPSRRGTPQRCWPHHRRDRHGAARLRQRTSRHGGWTRASSDELRRVGEEPFEDCRTEARPDESAWTALPRNRPSRARVIEMLDGSSSWISGIGRRAIATPALSARRITRTSAKSSSRCPGDTVRSPRADRNHGPSASPTFALFQLTASETPYMKRVVDNFYADEDEWLSFGNSSFL